MHNLAAFIRDTNLEPEILAKYRPGTIFLERGFTDATDQFGGFAGNHRYLILTAGASVRKLGEIGPNPEWNLCVFKPGCTFKVISVDREDDLAQITLLEFPIEELPRHRSSTLNEEEEILAKRATQWFEAALKLDPRTEHLDSEWQARLSSPLGIAKDGKFFEALSRDDEPSESESH